MKKCWPSSCAALAEWLRRQPAKLMGNARVGSNPAGRVFCARKSGRVLSVEKKRRVFVREKSRSRSLYREGLCVYVISKPSLL